MFKLFLPKLIKIYQNDTKFLYFSSTLIALLPLFFLFGPFLSDFMMIIASILALVFLINKSELKYFALSNFSLILTLIWAYLVFTSLISVNILLSLESTLFYFRFFIFGIASFLCIYYFKEKIYRLLFFTISISLLIILFTSFYELFFEESIFGICKGYVISGKPKDRISSIFCDELIVGSYIVKILPIYTIVTFEIFKKHKFYKNFYSIFLILLVIFIFFSGERSALVLSLLQLFIYLFLFNRKAILPILIILISFTLFIYNSNNNYLKGYKDRTLITFSNIVNIENKKLIFFTPGHESIFEKAIFFYKQSPVFGIGPKNFRYVCKINNLNCSTHPHNYYLQLLLETGILGFILLAAFYSFLLFKIINSFLKKDNITQTVLIHQPYLIMLFPLMPTQSFFNNYNSCFLFLPIGFLIYHYKDKIFKKLN